MSLEKAKEQFQAAITSFQNVFIVDGESTGEKSLIKLHCDQKELAAGIDSLKTSMHGLIAEIKEGKPSDTFLDGISDEVQILKDSLSLLNSRAVDMQLNPLIDTLRQTLPEDDFSPASGP